ncbi:hypothetical protein [Actinokineospora globicatena]|uniref:Copper(I)-binding protein n=1 Tax=Actinokineospora globicatena TaxID=103729 RepID=A0A9W6QQS9_9PSEU|nr:hypothetical protein [Actinokineospora globicatena]GLW93085.1 hypothetical protein Aglo03_39010 [Actinokineospora globicatena]
MSRAQQNPTGRPRLAPAVLGLGVAAVLVTAGCSSGQITQTDSQLPAVNGALAQTGQIAVRDAVLAYPKSGYYAEGADAPLSLTIVNVGGTADKLLEVTSPLAADVEVAGDTNLPGGFALVVGKAGEETAGKKSSAPTTPTPTTTSSAAPTSATSAAKPTSGAPSSTSASVAPTSVTPTTTTTKLALGTLEIVLKGASEKLYPGKNVPVTFVFEKAGPVTVNLPIAAPNGPREEHAGEH